MLLLVTSSLNSSILEDMPCTFRYPIFNPFLLRFKDVIVSAAYVSRLLQLQKCSLHSLHIFVKESKLFVVSMFCLGVAPSPHPYRLFQQASCLCPERPQDQHLIACLNLHSEVL